MFEQLKQQFLNSFDCKIEHLEHALEHQDTQALTVLVHQLAGSTGSYGLTAISELCIDIETRLHDDSINPTTQEKIQQLIRLMSEQIEDTAKNSAPNINQGAV